MTDDNTQINKTVQCKCGHINSIPLKTTIYKCAKCGEYQFSAFRGAVINKDGDYVY
jgi:DNA-directed RNA polymerase subunit RPC12/RpoP